MKKRFITAIAVGIAAVVLVIAALAAIIGFCGVLVYGVEHLNHYTMPWKHDAPPLWMVLVSFTLIFVGVSVIALIVDCPEEKPGLQTTPQE